jgi:hypothetical protein
MIDNQLICVAPDYVEQIWPHVASFVERALIRSKSDYSLDYVYRKLKGNMSLLWVVWNGDRLVACATTEICSLVDRGRVLVITTCGGRDAKAWLKFLYDLEDYARDEKCDRVRLYGREGWKRALRDQGYVEPWIALEKRIG